MEPQVAPTVSGPPATPGGGQDISCMLTTVDTQMLVQLAESLKPMAEAQSKVIMEKKREATRGKHYDGAELVPSYGKD